MHDAKRHTPQDQPNCEAHTDAAAGQPQADANGGPAAGDNRLTRAELEHVLRHVAEILRFQREHGLHDRGIPRNS